MGYYFVVVVNTGQQTAEQLAELKKALESVQSLEREKQLLEFQAEQFKLNTKQAKAAKDMEKEIQKAMQKHNLEPSPSEAISRSSKPIKLALRKRFELYYMYPRCFPNLVYLTLYE